MRCRATRVIEADGIDVVAARLQADFEDAVHAAKLVVPLHPRMHAKYRAILGLFELVAVGRDRPGKK